MSVGTCSKLWVRNPAHEAEGDGNNWKQSQERAGLPFVVAPEPWKCLLVPVEQSLLALTLLCLFRYKPSGEVGAFYENPARLRAHGVQRCLHLPYVPAAAAASAPSTAPRMLHGVCPSLEQSTGGDLGTAGRCHQSCLVCVRGAGTLRGDSRAGTEVCVALFFFLR